MRRRAVLVGGVVAIVAVAVAVAVVVGTRLTAGADRGAAQVGDERRTAATDPPEPDWVQPVPGWPGALVVGAGGRDVIVQSANRTVSVLSTRDGSVQWTTEVPEIWAQPPAIAPTGVLVSASDRVVALERATGERRWEASITGRAGPVAWVRSGDEELALVGSWEGTLTAFDGTDGSGRWTIERDGAVRAVPAVAPGVAIAVWHGADRTTVAAVDPEDGTVRWEHSVGPESSAPLLMDDVVIVGDGRGAIRAFSLDNGAEQWAAAGAGPFTPDLVAASAGSEVVAVDATGRLHVLDAATGSGHRVFELDVPVVRGRPQVGEQMIVVVAATGEVLAVPRATSGPSDLVERWTPDGFPVAAQLAGDRLLVALRLTEPGRVEALPVR